eukprot:5855187-Lingulodinium_polyedra.AAC.1
MGFTRAPSSCRLRRVRCCACALPLAGGWPRRCAVGCGCVSPTGPTAPPRCSGRRNGACGTPVG